MSCQPLSNSSRTNPGQRRERGAARSPTTIIELDLELVVHARVYCIRMAPRALACAYSTQLQLPSGDLPLVLSQERPTRLFVGQAYSNQSDMWASNPQTVAPPAVRPAMRRNDKKNICIASHHAPLPILPIVAPPSFVYTFTFTFNTDFKRFKGEKVNYFVSYVSFQSSHSSRQSHSADATRAFFP